MQWLKCAAGVVFDRSGVTLPAYESMIRTWSCDWPPTSSSYAFTSCLFLSHWLINQLLPPLAPLTFLAKAGCWNFFLLLFFFKPPCKERPCKSFSSFLLDLVSLTSHSFVGIGEWKVYLWLENFSDSPNHTNCRWWLTATQAIQDSNDKWLCECVLVWLCLHTH